MPGRSMVQVESSVPTFSVSADNRRGVGHKKCSLPLYLLPLPYLPAPFQTIAGGGGGGGDFTKSVHSRLRNKNIGVFDSPRVRFRILSSSSGTSPASPASSASAPAKDADDASDAGDVAHAGEGKDLNSERGGKISGRKGRRSGEKMP